MATPTPSSLGASAPGLLSPRYRVLLAGVFSQLLCIGIARFAYTPLLPVMQQQVNWSNWSGHPGKPHTGGIGGVHDQEDATSVLRRIQG